MMIQKTEHVKKTSAFKNLSKLDNQNDNYLPGMNQLGCGYNIFGEYATPMGIFLELFDFQKAPTKNVTFKEGYVVPKYADAIEHKTNVYRKIFGKSIEEYRKRLNIYTKLAGSYAFFSGSISADFKSNQYHDYKNEFSKVEQIISKWALKMLPEEAKPYLKDRVKNDIEKMDPKELFDRYGTHYLSAILVGGKAIMATSTDQTQFNSSTEIEVISEMTYKALTYQLSVENRTKYAKEIKNFELKSNLEIKTIGGSPELGGLNIKTPEGFKEWSKSIGNNPSFVDFDDDHALTPLWELCSNAKRKEELKKVFDEYATQITKESEQQINVELITDLDIITGDSSEIMANPGYEKFPIDLKENKGGLYVYICYKKNTISEILNSNGSLKPITDINIIKGKKDIEPTKGYKIIRKDLDEGRGRDYYIYVEFKPAETFSINSLRNYVKDLDVVSADYERIYPSKGFERINRDINENRGKPYTYLCYLKNFDD